MSRFEVVSGVGGHSLYLDDTRISGPKPWGGGQLVEAFNTEEKYVPERTCHVIGHRLHCDEGDEEWLLSCGHEVINESDEYPPNYCDECGAKVVDE